MLCNMPFEIKAGLLGDDARLIRGTLQPAVFPLGGCGCFCTSSTTLAESASVALLYSFSKRVLSSQAKPCFKGVLLLIERSSSLPAIFRFSRVLSFWPQAAFAGSQGTRCHYG